MPNVVEILVVAKDVTKEGFDGARSGMSGLATAASAMALTVGAAMVGIGVKSVEMASTFNAEMTKLNTQAGVSKDQLAGLSQGVLQLAGQVGQSPDSLAQALFHVESNFASLGITSDKALSLLKVAAQGASVGGANLVDVTNALTAAVASGIPGVQDFNQAMGTLNATVGAGDMSMQDLADALGTGVLATVKGFGLSIQDVGAALAVFGDNNIRGAKAGTDLRMAVQALAVPTKQGAALLDQMGLSADSLAKDMQSGGLLKALEDLKQHMTAAGISAVEQGQILTDMFGKKAGVGVNILYDQLDRLQSKYPDLAKAAGGFGAAWDTTQKTMKQQLADLRSGFDSLLITLGNAVMPALMGPLTGGVSKINAALSGGGAAKISGAIGGAVGGAVSGLEHFDWKPLVTAFKNIGDIVKQDLVPSLQNLGKVLGPVFMAAYRQIAPLSGALKSVWGVVRDIFSFVGGHATSFQALAVAILTIVAAMKAWKIATEVATAVQLALDVALDANPIGLIIIAIGALVAALIYLWTHSAAFRNFWIGLWNDIWGFLKAVGAWFAGPFVNFFVTAWHDIEGFFKSAATFVTNAWNDVISFFKSIPDKIKSFFTGIGDWFLSVGKSIVDGIWNGISSGWSWLESKVKGLAGDLLNAAKKALGIGSPSKLFADEVGKQISAGVAMGITNYGPIAPPKVSTAGMLPVAAAPSSSATTIHFAGNVDSALATAFQKLVRTGVIKIYQSQVIQGR